MQELFRSLTLIKSILHILKKQRALILRWRVVFESILPFKCNVSLGPAQCCGYASLQWHLFSGACLLSSKTFCNAGSVNQSNEGVVGPFRSYFALAFCVLQIIKEKLIYTYEIFEVWDT